MHLCNFFFFQAEDGIRDGHVTGVQTCALPISPETSAEFRDRVEEQAGYFGVTVDQVLQVGELAKQFTREKLTDSFLVRTCWEDAGGRSRMQRFYAFVQTRTGDLGEQLVENGLARAHPATAKPEGLMSAAAEWTNMLKLEYE